MTIENVDFGDLLKAILDEINSDKPLMWSDIHMSLSKNLDYMTKEQQDLTFDDVLDDVHKAWMVYESLGIFVFDGYYEIHNGAKYKTKRYTIDLTKAALCIGK